MEKQEESRVGQDPLHGILFDEGRRLRVSALIQRAQSGPIPPDLLRAAAPVMKDLLILAARQPTTVHLSTASSVWHVAVCELDLDWRTDVYLHLQDAIIRDFGRPELIYILLSLETHFNLVSTMALDWVMLGARGRKDPYRALHDLLFMASEGDAEKSASIIFGLLCSGDTRLLRFLNDSTDFLSPASIAKMAKMRCAAPWAGLVAFWLDRARTYVTASGEEAKAFIAVAVQLAKLGELACTTEIRDVRRNWGYLPGEPASEDNPEFDEGWFRKQVADALYAVEAAEAAPKLFSDVLLNWGLSPAAAETHRAQRPLH
jgi:hypothetical protein